jgi:hypothetical protein
MSKADEKDVRAIHRCSCPECCREPDVADACEHQAINRIIACTDERSRRLVAGFLARLYGHGGITRLARITGLDRNTVARGRRELDLRVVTIIDLPRITIIDGRGRLQIVRVPVASSLSAPNHSYQRIDGASVRLRWQESPHCN